MSNIESNNSNSNIQTSSSTSSTSSQSSSTESNPHIQNDNIKSESKGGEQVKKMDTIRTESGREYQHYERRWINNDWMDIKFKPFMGARLGRWLTIISCTLATYASIVSDYGEDPYHPDINIFTPIKEYHDRVASKLVGFDVRESIRKFEVGLKDLITPSENVEDRYTPEALETINQQREKFGQPPLEVEEKERKESSFLSKLVDSTDLKRPQTPPPKGRVETEDERLTRVIQDSHNDLKRAEEELEELVYHHFMEQQRLRALRNQNKSKS